jgi:hypothetical protein
MVRKLNKWAWRFNDPLSWQKDQYGTWVTLRGSEKEP